MACAPNGKQSMTSARPDSTGPDAPTQPLCRCVEQALTSYFDDLGDGQDASGLYELVISQVEKPLFEIVLNHYNGNITRTAQALGLSRGTVLGRLKKYGIVR